MILRVLDVSIHAVRVSVRRISGRCLCWRQKKQNKNRNTAPMAFVWVQGQIGGMTNLSMVQMTKVDWVFHFLMIKSQCLDKLTLNGAGE